jgi:hypothetical protein
MDKARTMIAIAVAVISLLIGAILSYKIYYALTPQVMESVVKEHFRGVVIMPLNCMIAFVIVMTFRAASLSERSNMGGVTTPSHGYADFVSRHVYSLAGSAMGRGSDRQHDLNNVFGDHHYKWGHLLSHRDWHLQSNKPRSANAPKFKLTHYRAIFIAAERR